MIVSQEQSERVSRWLWRVAIVLAVFFCFVTSYYGWVHSPHIEGLRQVYPSWYYGNYVIFDGYGPYSQWIAGYLAGKPRAAEHLAEFLRYDLHAHTPFYPFLCALVILVVKNVVLAHLVVTAAASGLALVLFAALIRILFPHLSYAGRHIALLGFLLHPGVTSSLLRPMPDSLALALLCGVWVLLARFRQAHKARYLVGTAALVILASLTKTVLVLLIPTVGLWLFVGMQLSASWARHRRLVRVGAGGVILAVATVAILWMSLYDAGSFRFLKRALDEAFAIIARPVALAPHMPAFCLFLVLSFGLYPVAMFLGRYRDTSAPKEHGALHWLWVFVYLLQRVFFVGVNLAYGRARYTMPLAPSVIVLSANSLDALWRRGGWWRVLALAPALFHLAIWCAYTMTLSGNMGGK